MVHSFLIKGQRLGLMLFASISNNRLCLPVVWLAKMPHCGYAEIIYTQLLKIVPWILRPQRWGTIGLVTCYLCDFG